MKLFLFLLPACYALSETVPKGPFKFPLYGQEKEVSMPTHNEAIKIVIDSLLNKETGVIKDLSEVGAVGHRVVHGGEYFSKINYCHG